VMSCGPAGDYGVFDGEWVLYSMYMNDTEMKWDDIKAFFETRPYVKFDGAAKTFEANFGEEKETGTFELDEGKQKITLKSDGDTMVAKYKIETEKLIKITPEGQEEGDPEWMKFEKKE